MTNHGGVVIYLVVVVVVISHGNDDDDGDWSSLRRQRVVSPRHPSPDAVWLSQVSIYWRCVPSFLQSDRRSQSHVRSDAVDVSF